MTISSDTLSTDLWNEMRTCLVAAAPYVVNVQTSETFVASIGAEFKDSAATKPTVIIGDALESEDTFKFGGTDGKNIINIPIDCYASNGNFANQLRDRVRTAVKAYDWGSMDLIAVSTDNAFNSPGQSKWKLHNITFTFDRE